MKHIILLILSLLIISCKKEVQKEKIEPTPAPSIKNKMVSQENEKESEYSDGEKQVEDPVSKKTDIIHNPMVPFKKEFLKQYQVTKIYWDIMLGISKQQIK